MNKLLVPYDFSKSSKSALSFALQMAKKASACSITLFHVIEHPTASAFKTMGVNDYNPMEIMYMKKLIEQVEVKMNQTIDDASVGQVEVKQKIKLGNPDNEITQEVENENIDLIIMGTSGSEGLDEFFVGSNAEKVVRYASCPVITMNKAANLDIIKEVVFASDFENVTDDFVRRLMSVCSLLEARLRVVIINTPANFTSSRLDNKLMDKFAKEHEFGEHTTEIYNYSNEEDGIVAYAEDIGAQMIALGTTQKKGVGHFLKGSIAEDVVNHAEIPVWTFHL
ncbi:MAG: universal stress protein [Cytophagales bacterium]|nr:universal stress protein [Cytophagales bacterium]